MKTFPNHCPECGRYGGAHEDDCVHRWHEAPHVGDWRWMWNQGWQKRFIMILFAVAVAALLLLAMFPRPTHGQTLVLELGAGGLLESVHADEDFRLMNGREETTDHLMGVVRLGVEFKPWNLAINYFHFESLRSPDDIGGHIVYGSFLIRR